MNLSVIVPLFNEVESIGELQSWIADVMQKNNFSYEVIYVDDGSNDGSWDLIEKMSGWVSC